MASPANSAAGGRPRAWLLPSSEMPLSTQGRFVVTKRGERVKLACANWYGAYSTTAVPGGLEVQPLQHIVNRMLELGFNCVRLCYSTQAQIENAVVNDSYVAANLAQFSGKRFFDVWDAVIAALTQASLMVIINNQVHKSGWCCVWSQSEGLWYEPGYSQQTWIASLVNMTSRHANNSMVVGIDLRNEVHDYGSVSLTWGDGSPTSDWALAATTAGNAVLAANPNVLIIVMSLCFGIELRPARDHPIALQVPRKVVYQVHNYLEYQVADIISSTFVAWSTVGWATGFIAFAVLIFMALQLKSWRRIGYRKPPAALAITSLSAWLCIFSLLGVGFCQILYNIITKAPACGWWARKDVLPAQFSLAALSGFWLLVAVLPFVPWSRCRRPRSPDLVAKAQASASDEDPVVADEDIAPVHLPVAPEHSLIRTEKSTRESDTESPALHSNSSTSPPPPRFDWDICCRLQCFIVCTFLVIIVLAGFIFSCVAEQYWVFEATMDRFWGFMLEDGQAYQAPVWMGEFGGSVRGRYWLHLLQYLSDKDVDFAYWAINGKKWSEGWIDTTDGSWVPQDPPGWVNETFGILNDDYSTVRLAWRMLDIASLMTSPATFRANQVPCDRNLVSFACGG